MKYYYHVRTSQGQSKTGEIEAADQVAAADILRRQNYFITSISAEEETKISFSSLEKMFSKRISLKDKIFFIQQLSVMLRSGFPLVPALKTLQRQTENKFFAEQIEEISEEVKGGVPLSSAFAKRPDIFPNLYVQVTKAGEKSGKLDKVLLKLSSDMSKTYDLTAKIKSALIYPAFIFIALIGVIILVMVVVIPQLSAMFADVGASLPLATRMLISISNAFIHFWWLILIIIAGLVIFYQSIKKQPPVRNFIDGFKLKIPVFGQLQKKAYLARFVRILSTLTSAGLPVLNTFKTLIDLTDNVHFKKDLQQATKKIEAGVAIGEALKKGKNFPPIICEMITIGEKSGNLDYVLRNLAKFLEKDVAYISKNLSTMLEPILMIIMGAGVAFVLIAVLGPIYNLVQVIK